MNKTLIVGIVAAVVIVGAAIVYSSGNRKGTAIQTQTDTCSIILFGQQYDVAKFRKIHKGGDVYICGTDMTQAYQQQHGNDTARIKQYLK